MPKMNLFVVDDEDSVRVTLSDDLRDLGYNVYDYGNPLLALLELDKIKPEIVFTDIRMPELNGIELLKEIKKNSPQTVVVVMTAFGAISSAVEAVKAGAFDYLNKPIILNDLKILLEQIRELTEIRQNVNNIVIQNQEKFIFESVIGNSKEMNEVFDLVKLVAPTTSTVMITGETGTGKELISNIIHYNSPRRDKPFIKLNCSVLARDVFESELFGHEKGAFTGAIKEKKGRFELANKGTLYLDDIDDIPFELQVKLLRVLEQQEFEKVGGEETLKVDVRLIASSKKDIQQLVSEGKFRGDLFFRLNTFPINLKPLRERKSDIRPLINYFADLFSTPKKVTIQSEVYELLESYSWPGNVRELKHLVERLVLISDQSQITTAHLPNYIFSNSMSNISYNFDGKPLDVYLSEVERFLIESALIKSSGNKSKASELLNIPYSTLRTKIEKYNL